LGLFCALAAVVALAQVSVSGGGTGGGASSGGASFWNGTVAPTNILGGNGDFYLNTSTYCLYGPKAAGLWPAACMSLIGQPGNPGPPLGYVAENMANKGTASGYAPLNSSVQVPLINLPIIPYTQISGVQLALGFTPLNPANNLGDLSNATAARSNLGLVIGTNVEPHSALLDGFAGLAVNGIVAVSGSSASSGTLSGDVSTNGLAATVNSVGGSTAATLHSAEMLANAATSNNINSTIVMRDRSGNINAAQVYAGGAAVENTANKGKANGYAPLDGGGLLPAANLPVSAVTATTVNNGTLSGSFVNLLASGPISTSATGAGAFMMTAGAGQTPPPNTVGLQAPPSVPTSFNCTWWGIPVSGVIHATATAPCILSPSLVQLTDLDPSTLPAVDISGSYTDLLNQPTIPAPLGFTPVNVTSVGVANGIAPLDATGLLPIASLPNPIVTAGVGGVTAGYLVGRDTSNPTRYIATTAGSCGSGIAASTAAAGSTFQLYSMAGTILSVVADNTVTAGDVMTGGSVIPGRVADSGFAASGSVPSTTCTVGVAQGSAVAGGTFKMLFNGSSSYGTQATYTALGTGAIAETQAAKNAQVISVKDFGATGAGYPTDDTAAFVAALAYARTVAGSGIGGTSAGIAPYVPCGTYYFAAGLEIHGEGLVGEDQNCVTFTAAPSSDVFYQKDPLATGYIATLNYAQYKNFVIVVDDTVNAATSFPHRTAGQGTTSGYTWTIGNCGMAFPDTNAGYGNQQVHWLISKVLITAKVASTTNVQNNNTCGIFAQGVTGFYESNFSDLNIRGTTFGIVQAPPQTESSRASVDSNVFNNVVLLNEYPLVWYGGTHEMVTGLKVYASGYTTFGRGIFILADPSYASDLPQWNFIEPYVEGNSLVGQFGQFDGLEHTITGGTLKQDANGNGYIVWNANNSVMTNTEIGDEPGTGGPVLQINGNNNRFDIILAVQDNTLGSSYVDNGIGNMITEHSNTFPTTRASNPSHTKYVPTSTFDPGMLTAGSVLTPYEALTDLLLTPDGMMTANTPMCDAIASDATSLSGKYCSMVNDTKIFSNPDNWFRGWTLGKWIPQQFIRLAVSAKASVATTNTWKIIDSTGTTLCSAVLTWTTAYATQTMYCDLTSSTGTWIEVESVTPTTAATIYVGWLAFQPFPTDHWQSIAGSQAVTQSGGGITVDPRQGPVVNVTMTANLSAVTVTSPRNGEQMDLVICQPSGTTYTLSLPVAFLGTAAWASPTAGSCYSQWFEYNSTSTNWAALTPPVVTGGSVFVAPAGTPATLFLANATSDIICSWHLDTSIGSDSVTAATNAAPIVFTLATNPETLGYQVGQTFYSTGYAASFTIGAISSTTITATNGTAPGTANPGGTIYMPCVNNTVDGSAVNTAFQTTGTVAANTFVANTSLAMHAVLQVWTPAQAPSIHPPGLYYSTLAIGSQQQTATLPSGALPYTSEMNWNLFSPDGVVLFTTMQSQTLSLAAFEQDNRNVQPQYPSSVFNTSLPISLKTQWNAAGLATATYVSGGTFSGTGNCSLTTFNDGGASTPVATIAIASGVAGAITVTAPGYGFTAAPTTAAAVSGTATCSSTITFTSTLGGAQGAAIRLNLLRASVTHN